MQLEKDRIRDEIARLLCKRWGVGCSQTYDGELPNGQGFVVIRDPNVSLKSLDRLARG